VIYSAMLCDTIQDQGHGGLKCAKMADFKGCLLRQYACNQQTVVNYDTSGQYLILSGQIFDIYPRLVSHDLEDVPPLANEYCVLRGVDWQSHMELIY